MCLGEMRRKLAQKAFAMTASYDRMIADWLDSQSATASQPEAEMPETCLFLPRVS